MSDSTPADAPPPRNAALTRALTVSTPPSPAWPVLARYDEQHLARIAMPIGGIGTGTISLGGRGDLRDWELVNRPAKGYAPHNTFFALHVGSPDGRKAVTRAIEGPIDVREFEGHSGSPAQGHGLPRFRRCNFAAAYPLAQVLLEDDDVPLRVRIEAFNPMTPLDTDLSGIPIAVLRFVLINPTTADMDATVCGTLENFIGSGGDPGTARKNVNELRSDGSVAAGLFMRSTDLDPRSPAWGTLALATTSPLTSHRTAWSDLSWGGDLLDFWDDFSADGRLDRRQGTRGTPFGSVAASARVPAGGEAALTFLIAWHFPNRPSWTPPHETVGNYYTTRYADAWDVVQKTAPVLAEFERATVTFVRSFVQSDVPAVIKEAALCNASTLRTQTAFRTADGRFFGWEGCNDQAGCCHGSCTHVWNYEQTTPFLYGALSRSMREVEFAHATRDSGYQSFRVNLPLHRAAESRPAAVDGQMGTLVKLYRDWRLSGDDPMLRRLWPAAKRALAFAWIPDGWDADRDGVMEGCQHNTMDIEYYGPNPQVGVWYLAALRTAQEMAYHLGDTDFAATCHDLLRRGRDWIDKNLFNGEYYEQHILPAKDAASVADDLRLGVGAADPSQPDLQLGAGCLADQLVGQLAAHVTGLGYLLDPGHVRAALSSVYRHNFRDDFFGHFNAMRSYALGDEQGLVVATYPRGQRPLRPFPYCDEVWTGLEYTAAAGLLYEGLTQEALRIVAAARDRHDGRKRNPFDEPECGHHYARAMAAWACLLAWTGFGYDAVEQTIRFGRASAGVTTRWFWSSGGAWGTFRQAHRSKGIDIMLEVLGGELRVRSIRLTDAEPHAFEPITLKPGDKMEGSLKWAP